MITLNPTKYTALDPSNYSILSLGGNFIAFARRRPWIRPVEISETDSDKYLMRKFGWPFFIFLTVVGFIYYFTIKPVSVSTSLPSLTPGPFSVDGYQRLKEFIQQNKIGSVDELLQLLPVEYKKYYSLVYRSRSIQMASAEFPRIIITGPDAKLILAVSGHPFDPRSENVEVIAWDKKGYADHEINFANTINPYVDQPTKCDACHGTTILRPNWDIYNGWRGVYGSIERAGTDIIGPHSPEDQHYKKFLMTSFHRHRYAHLPKRIGDTSQYGPGEIEKAKGFGLTLVGDGAAAGSNSRMNESLSSLLQISITENLLNDPNYHKFKYALLGLSLFCPMQFQGLGLRGDSSSRPEEFTAMKDIESFLPEKLRKGPSYIDVFGAVSKKLSRDFDQRQTEILKFNFGAPQSDGYYMPSPGFGFYEDDRAVLASWVFLTEKLGINIYEWSHEFEYGSLPTGGFLNLEFFGHYFRSEVLTKDSEFSEWKLKKDELNYESPRELSLDFCKKMRESSVAALQTLQYPSESKILSEIRAGHKIPFSLRTCVSCHASPNNIGKAIPFHDREEMLEFVKSMPDGPKRWIINVKQRLRSKNRDLKMPPPENYQLTPRDIRELEAYLDSFVQ